MSSREDLGGILAMDVPGKLRRLNNNSFGMALNASLAMYGMTWDVCDVTER